MISIFLANRWTRIYYSIIDRARGRIKHRRDGLERHHIVPKSFFKSYSKSGWLDGHHNDPANLIVLTAREHLVCHRLLVRMTTGMAKAKMWLAIKRMIGKKNAVSRYGLNSRLYEITKMKCVDAASLLMTERYKDSQMRKKTSEAVKRSCAIPEVQRRRQEAQNQPDTKGRRSASLKRHWKDQDVRDENKVKQIKIHNTPEIREKHRQAAYETNKRPEVIEAKRRASTGLNNPRADHQVYMFVHKNGHIEQCTRWDLEQKYGVSVKRLFHSKPSLIAHGWRLLSPDPCQ